VASGPAPLTVKFDGTTSTADDGDQILDYHWDFGDGQTSGLPAPTHTYLAGGAFVVKLKVIAGGGAEDQAETTINVSSTSGSLQFDGNQFATLTPRPTDALSALTVEAWFKASDAGGVLLTFGQPAIRLGVAPTQQKVQVGIGDKTTDLTAANLAGLWHFVAVTYDGTGGAYVYLDGAALNSTALDGAGDITPTTLTLGLGWHGKAAEVHLWSKARTASDMMGAGGSLTGPEDGVLGVWPLNEGAGQLLGSHVLGAPSGTLGATDAAEATDPAWSTDGPPVH
jgi:PKD repeat protein